MQALPGPWGRSKQALPILAIAVAALQSPPTAATPTARSCLCLPFSKGPALQSAPQAAVPGTGRASGLSAALTGLSSGPCRTVSSPTLWARDLLFPEASGSHNFPKKEC